MTDSRKLDLILEKIGSLDCKISTLDSRMDSFETRMDSLETKMDSIETRMDSLETRMDSLDNKMTALDNKVNSLDTKTNSFESNLKEIKSHVRHTDLVLENEIRINIQRVAEGHLDLSRILHDAMHPSSEVEMLSLRLRMVESEVRQLKAKVS